MTISLFLARISVKFSLFHVLGCWKWVAYTKPIRGPPTQSKYLKLCGTSINGHFKYYKYKYFFSTKIKGNLKMTNHNHGWPLFDGARLLWIKRILYLKWWVFFHFPQCFNCNGHTDEALRITDKHVFTVHAKSVVFYLCCD